MKMEHTIFIPKVTHTEVMVSKKKCNKCGKSKDVTEFHKRVAAKDGLHSHCKSCVSMADRNRDPDKVAQHKKLTREWRDRNRDRIATYNARRYEEDPQYFINASRKSERKNPQRARARKAVSRKVQMGLFPPAWAMVCEKCEEAQAAHWHHHNGYEKEHMIDVIAVCTTCHGKEHWK
jgi:RNase P subunit RPR2